MRQHLAIQQRAEKPIEEAQAELLEAIKVFRRVGGEIGFHGKKVLPSKEVIQDYVELKVSRAKDDNMRGYVIFSSIMNPTF